MRYHILPAIVYKNKKTFYVVNLIDLRTGDIVLSAEFKKKTAFNKFKEKIKGWIDKDFKTIERVWEKTLKEVQG